MGKQCPVSGGHGRGRGEGGDAREREAGAQHDCGGGGGGGVLGSVAFVFAVGLFVVRANALYVLFTR